MKRFYRVLLVLTLLSLAFAQPPLNAYEEAKTALERSMAAMSEDAVASLDALRQARDAFTPLDEGLEPTLRRGLQETFSRAEQAIVNESQTDLRVQATVLLGGFQRGLYEQALERAAAGNLAQANAFLEVLATDLQLSPRQLEGDSVQSLQTGFEQRLATRSLAELTALSELPATDRGGVYERLSQLYSHVFVVQDSPRLPAQTQSTIVEAIRLHIAREPLEASLSALRAQLQSFQSAAAAAQPGQTAAPVAANPAALDPATVNPAVVNPVTPLPQESNPLRHWLFMTAGLFALIAIVRLLTRLRESASVWQDAATVLLLLPALAEGVFALAQWLAPLLNLPLLAQAQRFSLFTNPVTQLLTGFLIVCAALCLMLARRTVPTAAGQAQPSSHPEPTAPPQMKPPSRSPLAAPGKINWDEDF